MNMKNNIVDDIVEWDIVNWSKALDFWDKNLINASHLNCLELGSRKGGLSLYLAKKGNFVICSDIFNPSSIASVLHVKYNVQNQIKYKSIDALNIDYQNCFDIIAFKSIIGGASSNNNNQNKKILINEIYKALKPGGKLIFAENLDGSLIHKYLRKKFRKWGDEWNYVNIREINLLFSNFSSIDYVTVGFFGAFGFNEKQRKFLGLIDTFIEKWIPQRYKYICIGIATK